MLARYTRQIMSKKNKKLTPAQKKAKKEAKAERQKKYQWVFMNGKCNQRFTFIPFSTE